MLSAKQAPARGPEPCHPRALDKSQEVCFIPVNDAESLGAGRHGCALVLFSGSTAPSPPATSQSSDLKNSSHVARLRGAGDTRSKPQTPSFQNSLLAMPLTPWQLQRVTDQRAAEHLERCEPQEPHAVCWLALGLAPATVSLAHRRGSRPLTAVTAAALRPQGVLCSVCSESTWRGSDPQTLFPLTLVVGPKDGC